MFKPFKKSYSRFLSHLSARHQSPTGGVSFILMSLLYPHLGGLQFEPGDGSGLPEMATEAEALLPEITHTCPPAEGSWEGPGQEDVQADWTRELLRTGSMPPHHRTLRGCPQALPHIEKQMGPLLYGHWGSHSATRALDQLSSCTLNCTLWGNWPQAGLNHRQLN